MKALTLIAVLISCATASPKDVRLAIQRGAVGIATAVKTDDYDGAQKTISDMKTAYRKAMGESPIFEYWADLFSQAFQVSREGDAAKKAGLDTVAYEKKIQALLGEIQTMTPFVTNEIQQAEIEANDRSQTMALIGGLVTGIAGGVIAGAAAGSARSPAPAFVPAPAQTQTNCTVVPMGRNTVTGQSYGQTVRCW
jgi:hypothetical protein